MDFETAAKVIDEHPDWRYGKESREPECVCGEPLAHVAFAGDIGITFLMHQVDMAQKEER